MECAMAVFRSSRNSRFFLLAGKGQICCKGAPARFPQYDFVQAYQFCYIESGATRFLRGLRNRYRTPNVTSMLNPTPPVERLTITSGHAEFLYRQCAKGWHDVTLPLPGAATRKCLYESD